MRILYLDINCKENSTGKIVYDLFSECKSHNIEASVCYGRGPKIKENGIYKFGLDFETFIHALLTRLTGYTGCFSYFSTRRLIKYIKKFNPDIVHIHELHAYFVNVKQLLMFLKRQNYKVVFTNHCEFLYTGKCGYSRGCTRYSNHCGSCPLKKEYPKSLFFDHTKKMLEIKKSIFKSWDNNIYFVSPSQWLDNQMDISFLKEFKRTVIHNGVDTSGFIYNPGDIKNELNIPADCRVVLTVAPNLFSDLKGGYRFLSIARKMAYENKIVFIGVGETDKCLTSKPNNVIVLPLIKDREKLVNLYSACDVFLILSNRENFPTTSLEAQCCGSKIIGYNVGGVSETILDGNGIVVDYDNEDAIIDAIKEVLLEKYNHQDISERSKSVFSKETMFKNYLEIYKKVCD